MVPTRCRTTGDASPTPPSRVRRPVSISTKTASWPGSPRNRRGPRLRRPTSVRRPLRPVVHHRRPIRGREPATGRPHHQLRSMEPDAPGPATRPYRPHRQQTRHGRPGLLFPSQGLDTLLRLEETLQRKLAYADAAIGAGDVLPGFRSRFEVNLEDTRAQIQAIRDENPNCSRTEARRLQCPARSTAAADPRRSPIPSPDTMCSRCPGCPAADFVSRSGHHGYVFCMRMGDHANPWFRFVPAQQVQLGTRRGVRGRSGVDVDRRRVWAARAGVSQRVTHSCGRRHPHPACWPPIPVVPRRSGS